MHSHLPTHANTHGFGTTEIDVFWFFCLRFTKQGKYRAMYSLLKHCGLWARLPWSGCCDYEHKFTLSCFHPKPSFVMHSGNAILNPKFADL